MPVENQLYKSANSSKPPNFFSFKNLIPRVAPRSGSLPTFLPLTANSLSVSFSSAHLLFPSTPPVQFHLFSPVPTQWQPTRLSPSTSHAEESLRDLFIAVTPTRWSRTSTQVPGDPGGRESHRQSQQGDECRLQDPCGPVLLEDHRPPSECVMGSTLHQFSCMDTDTMNHTRRF